MELSQIRYFIRLAEMLSFTEAAKASFITQSALSVSIRQLEEELGVRLFDRIGKKVFLTDYGKLFLGYARNAVDSLQDGVRELNALNNVFKGKLHIGVTYSMSELLKSHLLSFTEKYPDIRITITMFNTVEDIVQNLLSNRLDVAVTYRPEQLPSSVAVQSLSEYPLSVIVADTHPLASFKEVAPADLTSYPLATFVKGMRTRNMMDQLLDANGVKIEPHIEVNDTCFVLDLVETGNWISILAPVSLHTHPHTKAIPIKGKTENLSACVMWMKGKSKQPLYQTLINDFLV